ncbi:MULTISPECIES: hypothetical protein [unclassified Bradyrhizobium]|uniref:hypothetical protein n=1 Tax=unclassified Bradyrhizobium TaxID=2631580 RepID=UPI001BA6B8E7|nr:MULTISPECIES: hypothetical protein [unclassified Bradyrhizobium]MBR1226555.1 hypothetical protein [Bradyrhizobium sp. AUGA SZCCT0176]MBR1234721.1 hypothetical protein [Bradyrhizobium sp. AUGA SZCCT0182]MBR1297080.1 hypothetical protein [Bradyrhizobium sp. AUGA SZCCT0042]
MTTVPTAVSTETVAAPPPVPSAASLSGLGVALIIITVLELLDGISVAWGIFGDPEIEVPAVSGAASLMHPLLALAALVFAGFGRVRPAIVMLGAVIIVTWLKYMPTVVSSGIDAVGFGAIWSPAQIIVFPLLAVCAIGLAARNRRLLVATALASLPTLFNIAAIIAIAIGLAIRGA